MTQKEYDALVSDFEQQSDKTFRLSYAIRCLQTGDGEQARLTNESDEVISSDYLPCLLEAWLLDPKADGQAHTLDDLTWSPSGLYLEQIWRSDIYQSNYKLWESIVCSCDYDFYQEISHE